MGSRLASKLLGFWLSGFGLGLGSRLASKPLISRLLAMHLPHWITPLASLGLGLPLASMLWLGFGLWLGLSTFHERRHLSKFEGHRRTHTSHGNFYSTFFEAERRRRLFTPIVDICTGATKNSEKRRIIYSIYARFILFPTSALCYYPTGRI